MVVLRGVVLLLREVVEVVVRRREAEERVESRRVK